MRRQLFDGLTALWRASLAARRALSPTSPVAALDRILPGRAAERRTPSRHRQSLLTPACKLLPSLLSGRVRRTCKCRIDGDESDLAVHDGGVGGLDRAG